MASIRFKGVGRWEVRYRDATGRMRGKTFDRKTDARRFVGEVETDVRRGDWVDPHLARTRFGDWAEEYLATIAHLKPKTRDRYEHTMRTQVLPELANWPVAAIQQVDLRRLLSAKQAQGLSASSLKKIKLAVRHVLELARGSGAIKVNPCEGVKVPRGVSREPVFLTAGEVERLAHAAREPYDTLIRFAVETGMRPGEICGVRIGRVNLLKGAVEVVDTLPVLRGKVIEDTTKTYERRTVKIGRALCEELGEYLARRAGRAGQPLHERERLFTAPRGGLLRSDLLLKRQVRPAAKRAGLSERMTLHDLRHTSAALMIELGAHPKANQERLGHSSISVTMDVYGHLFPSLDETLAEALDDLLVKAREAASRSVAGDSEVAELRTDRTPDHSQTTFGPQNDEEAGSMAGDGGHRDLAADQGR